MDNNPKGPYKHYERPTKPRTSGERPSSSKKWGIVIAILIIILVILIPTVHYLASNHNSERIQEVQKINRAKHKERKARNKKVTKTKKNKTNAAKKKSKTYHVKSGDTLSSIAQKYNMSVSELAKLNKISNTSQLYAGQTLKVK